MSDQSDAGVWQSVKQLFTADGQEQTLTAPDEAVEWGLSEEGVAHVIIELHDREDMAFRSIAQCFPLTRRGVEQLYHEYREDYPNVE